MRLKPTSQLWDLWFFPTRSNCDSFSAYCAGSSAASALRCTRSTLRPNLTFPISSSRLSTFASMLADEPCWTSWKRTWTSASGRWSHLEWPSTGTSWAQAYLNYTLYLASSCCASSLASKSLFPLGCCDHSYTQCAMLWSQQSNGKPIMT